MKKRNPFQISLLLVCLLWLSSCVKDDISVKDLDGTIGIKGAVVLPVAKSTITFKDFIEYLDPKYISEDPQHVFVLKYTPKGYDFDVHLDPGNVTLAPQSLSLAGYSGNVSATTFNNILQSEIGSVEIDLRQINTQIIQQLDSILTTSFSIDVALNYSGINIGTNKLRITLIPDPTIFVGAKSAYPVEKAASELNASKVFTVAFSNVRLKPVNNKIKFKFLIEALPNPTSNLVLSTTPSFSYGITARDIKYTAAFGQFNFSQPSQSGTIDISELNEFLNADSYLPYAEPKLTLDVTTNARLPLAINLDYLRSYSLSAPSQYYYAHFSGVTNTVFPLSKMPTIIGTEVTNPVVMNKDADKGSIDQLFSHKGIDAIAYSFGVNTTSGISDQFVMSASKFQVAPTVEIPLSFGPGAEIAIKDTVSLGDSFSSFLNDNDIEKVGVLLTINNYTSSSMVLSMVLQDATHNNLSGEKKITLAATTTGDQSFSLPFTSTELKNARYILLNYKMQAKDVQSTLTIKSTDFLKARVGVYVKGSVTF